MLNCSYKKKKVVLLNELCKANDLLYKTLAIKRTYTNISSTNRTTCHYCSENYIILILKNVYSIQ